MGQEGRETVVVTGVGEESEDGEGFTHVKRPVG